jgi:hypothetical protein
MVVEDGRIREVSEEVVKISRYLSKISKLACRSDESGKA